MKAFFTVVAVLISMVAQASSLAYGAYSAPIYDLTVFVFRGDGSVIVTNDTLKTRASMEQLVRIWDRYSKESNDGEEEPERQQLNTNQLSSEELEKKIRQMAVNAVSAYRLEVEPKFERIEINTNTVRTVSTVTYGTARDFMASALMSFSQAAIPVGNVELSATNGQIQMTLAPYPQMRRYSKTMADQWRQSGGSNELRVIFPGKIISSDLGPVDGSATSLKYGAYSDESIESMVKRFEKPIVITADAAGLKLDQRLSAKALHRSTQAEENDDTPITAAAPGFLVEPVSVTTSTTYLFPEGEKLLATRNRHTGRGTGVVVQAKLFAPKGRAILKVTDLQILAAADDKGRSIVSQKQAVDAENSNFQQFTTFGASGKPDAAATIQLRLPLPARDAQSIAEVKAEAVTTTVSKWNDLTVTNLHVNTTNEFDLGTILPGAKLVIRKTNTRGSQTTIDADLRGPREVNRIDIQYKTKSEDDDRFGGNRSSMYSRRVATSGGITTRTVQISHYSYGREGKIDTNAPVVLLVRYPADLKRERVSFTMESLDLF